MKRFLKPKKKPFKETTNIAIFHLKASLKKLRRNSEGLKVKEKKLLAKCIELQSNNNHKRAVIYANECAEIRYLAHLVLSSELALEQALVRLHTLNELDAVMGSIAPVIGIIAKTKDRITGVLPSIAGNLDEITGMLNTSITETGSVNAYSPSSPAVNQETIKILEKANDAAEERLRKRFPEIPQEFPSAENSKALIPIALTASGQQVTYDRLSLQKHVYSYIKANDGNLSVVQCASSLGVFPTDVEQAILKLKDEGKIVVK